MTGDYQTLLKTRILQDDTFIRAAFSGSQKGQAAPWVKVSLRPVSLKGKPHLQFSYFDGQKDISKNYAGAEAETRLDELLALPFNSVTAQTAAETVRVQFSKKGRAIIHRANTPARKAKPPTLAHDRRKRMPLPANRPDPFLQATGIMTAGGKIRAGMEDKFRQINRFLELVAAAAEFEAWPGDSPIRVVDCGCGSAHLTFAAYHYLTNALGRPTRMVGIDLKADLLARRAEQARQLGWEGLTFEPAAIIDYTPPAPPDIVLALHACDTATDEALAQAVRWGSRYIFSVPCCHHHLHAQLPPLKDAPPAAKPVFRHGILKARWGDILTDACRALILRLMGYRADVVEFIAAEHTAKNLMIRAVKTTRPGNPQLLKEYKALKTAWQVTPYLETLLTASGFNLEP
ncbi:MAG: SAM-dependent methyltransferase [Anaerolineae bacterium]